MDCKFLPGDRLVCRIAKNAPLEHRTWGGVPCPLQVREIYTCREVMVNRHRQLVVKLEEISKLRSRRGTLVRYPGFKPSWFEKLVDLSQFYGICATAQKQKTKETTQ